MIGDGGQGEARRRTIGRVKSVWSVGWPPKTAKGGGTNTGMVGDGCQGEARRRTIDRGEGEVGGLAVEDGGEA